MSVLKDSSRLIGMFFNTPLHLPCMLPGGLDVRFQASGLMAPYPACSCYRLLLFQDTAQGLNLRLQQAAARVRRFY